MRDTHTSKNAFDTVINFGLGGVVISGGVSGGAPSIGFRILRHGFKTGDSIPLDTDLSGADNAVLLRFFDKASLQTLSKAVNAMLANFEVWEESRKALTYWVQTIPEEEKK